MFMRKSKQQTLADAVTKNVLKYMASSGMLFTQKDINNIHILITKTVAGGLPKRFEPAVTKPFKKKNKSTD